MGKHRILIVDDEESIANYLVQSLRLLAPEYDVETARSARGALAMMNRQPFDVMVTDLRMPGMDGLELMRRVRERHPHVRLILSTAYGNDKVEAQAYQIGACRYLNKPFKAEELVDALHQAVAPASAPGRATTPVAPGMRLDAITQRLSDLLFELAAHCILLADVSGGIVAQVGDSGSIDPPALASLIAGGLSSSFELARALHETEAVTLKYLEGTSYDVYASNVDTRYFVVLVYDKRGGQGSRLGMVWLYLRRALTELQDLIQGGGAAPTPSRRTPSQEPARPTAPPRSTRSEPSRYDAERSRRDTEPPTWRRETAPDVYAPPPRQETPAARRRDPEPAAPAREEPPARGRQSKEPPVKPGAPPEPASPPVETFDLAQAIAMGLLDASWFQDMDDEPGQE